MMIIVIVGRINNVLSRGTKIYAILESGPLRDILRNLYYVTHPLSFELISEI